MNFSQEIEKLKESYQEKLENTFQMYKEAIKEHAYQSAMNNLEDNYVPLDEFIAEQKKVEVGHSGCCKWVRNSRCSTNVIVNCWVTHELMA